MPRLLLNLERVGEDLGLDFDEHGGRDHWIHSTADEGCLKLAQEAGWLQDLEQYRGEMSTLSVEILDSEKI